MEGYNEDYLNGLIANAKKSWEGVDVDSYMNNLRDMETIKCKDLMVGDWCRDGHGFPMQITNVGDDYAYATFEGLEGDHWEFDDKDCKPCAIEITEELETYPYGLITKRIMTEYIPTSLSLASMFINSSRYYGLPE